MYSFALIVVALLASFWLLHALYIAVMALRDRRNEGTLSALDKVLGYPTLVMGLVLDALVNLLMSFVLLELPQWQRGELLLTPRMRRLARLPADSTGLAKYRRWLCRWLLGQIDQHDKSGGHDLPS